MKKNIILMLLALLCCIVTSAQKDIGQITTLETGINEHATLEAEIIRATFPNAFIYMDVEIYSDEKTGEFKHVSNMVVKACVKAEELLAAEELLTGNELKVISYYLSATAKGKVIEKRTPSAALTPDMKVLLKFKIENRFNPTYWQDENKVYFEKIVTENKDGESSTIPFIIITPIADEKWEKFLENKKVVTND